jgi:hypothetical protein
MEGLLYLFGCIDYGRIIVSSIFELIIENNKKINDISKNMRRVLLF